ncbi:hypothetical protein [Natrinema marinum]|uniref:hypothetical protein n=1 Tax=Natrinema marinum TaxID=2961598 RepID=UPI0020C8E1AE|nr:hypothetical protein [Natrinema marinum]
MNDGDPYLDQRRDTVYCWFNPESGDTLYRTDGAETDLFFHSVGEAERFLKQEAAQYTGKDYTRMCLYEIQVQRVEYAANVLMDQSEIDDFQ